MRIQEYKVKKEQDGSVLIVALVMLVVITLIGTASMRTSTMELKMVSSQRDRDASFVAAEAALKSAEVWLDGEGKPNIFQLVNGCAPADTCYEKTCAGGLCFDGSFSPGTDKINCTVGGDNTTPPIEFWSDSMRDVWNDDEKHRSVDVEGVSEKVKYIIEFLCYVDTGDGTVFSSLNPNEGLPLYRITALAEGDAKKSKVMLQSTYRVGSN